MPFPEARDVPVGCLGENCCPPLIDGLSLQSRYHLGKMIDKKQIMRQAPAVPVKAGQGQVAERGG